VPYRRKKLTFAISSSDEFLFFIVKAAVLKQQISKFYPQILSTEDSFYIYDRPVTEINVIASFCALNLRIKFCSFPLLFVPFRILVWPYFKHGNYVCELNTMQAMFLRNACKLVHG